MELALNELAAATETLRIAQTKEAQARRDTVNAINRLNAAQKAVTTIVAEMQRNAPRESDWADPVKRLAITTAA